MTDPAHHPLSHLGFRHIEPSALFKNYIHSYWFIDATCFNSQGYQHFLHPDGGIGFIFNYGSALSYDGQNERSIACLDGTNTKSINLGLSANIQAVGIRFKPAGARAFFAMPLHELRNRRLELADLNSSLFMDLYHQIPEQRGLAAKVAIIEKVLAQACQKGTAISPQMLSAMQRIRASRGMLPIATLSQSLDINQRKLERLFKTQMGMSANEYTRVVRTEHARTVLKTTSRSLADVTYQFGYYDQAHFNKSFKSVVGITPGEYRLRCRS